MKHTLQLKSRADVAKLRRLALGHQGLIQASPFGRGATAAQRAIAHLGYVQIDTISVVERAHHHVLASRVPNYTPTMLHKLLERKVIFEHWAHAAAFLPMEDFRFSLPFKQSVAEGRFAWSKGYDKKLGQALLERITSEGPLRSRDVEEKRGKGSGWWDWKPAKRALELLYMRGDLMVTARDGFQKTYDLTERVVPETIETTPPTPDEFAAHLLEQVLRSHGFASLKGMTYLRRNDALRKAMKQLVDRLVADQQLMTFKIKDSTTFFVRPDVLETRAPSAPARAKLLSPFDNSVIQRERVISLFEFDYQIECYVPEAKRQYGYFSLPILFRDRFIGRADCKAHRKQQRLEIKHLCLNEFSATNFELEEVLDALSTAMNQFMTFNQCTSVQLTRVTPKHLQRPAKQVLER